MTQTAARRVRFLLRHPAQCQGFRERLEGDLALTMLWIPPGRFWMGSPSAEPERDPTREGPQHLVQLEGLFMAQTPITQAQWRTVARWQPRNEARETWGRDLNPDPSPFQGKKARLLKGEANTDQRPVEQVNWHDAMEFCQPPEPAHRPHLQPAERSAVGIRLPGGQHHAVSLRGNDHHRPGQLRRELHLRRRPEG
jgi:formylglycine-generating enzyme required for sulfatase activity